MSRKQKRKSASKNKSKKSKIKQQKNKNFGRCVKAGLYAVAVYEGKNVSAIETELTHKIYLSEKTIQRFKSGDIPRKFEDVEILAETIVTRGRYEYKWLKEFLKESRYPPEQTKPLLNRLYPPDSMKKLINSPSQVESQQKQAELKDDNNHIVPQSNGLILSTNDPSSTTSKSQPEQSRYDAYHKFVDWLQYLFITPIVQGVRFVIASLTIYIIYYLAINPLLDTFGLPPIEIVEFDRLYVMISVLVLFIIASLIAFMTNKSSNLEEILSENELM